MSSLDSIQRQNGARFASYHDAETAADFGSADDEHRALCESCGLFDRSWTSGLKMTGADRARFLNGLVTCDVAKLEAGGGTYGFLTQVKGRILADLRVLALDEELWLELPPGKSEEIAQHLGKYVIADQVEIHSRDDVSLSLIGPASTDVLAGIDLPTETHAHLPADHLGVAVRVVRDVGFGDVPAWTLLADRDASATLWEKLVEAGGVSAVGREAWERLRVETARPLYGQDFGTENFPQETGLEDAVSYTKGCYLGQEVVARIHYRGGVNKLLRGLRFGSVDAPVGRALLHDGREAGVVTSAVRSAALGHVGLAILHKRVEPGMQLELRDGGTASVVELPFA